MLKGLRVRGRGRRGVVGLAGAWTRSWHCRYWPDPVLCTKKPVPGVGPADGGSIAWA